MSELAKTIDTEINPDKPWENVDYLKREQVAKDFTNLLRTVEQSFVVALNAPYGSGKTFFLKRWQCDLPKDEFVSVFFNAWDTDFCNQPFIAFMHAILSQLKHTETSNTEAFQTRWKNVKSAGVKIALGLGKDLLKHTIPATGDAIAGMVSNPEISKGVSDGLTSAFNQGDQAISGNTFETGTQVDLFDEYKKRRAELESFKQTLRALVQEFDGKKLVIFVDELERCRPTYAVELLECIKHLFDVDGIIFVLATDRSQLQHTISNLYGNGMDSEGYLRRFIDIELKFPDPEIEDYIKYLTDYFKLGEVLTNKACWRTGLADVNK